MSKINIASVVKGGLLAGLIINISEFILNMPVAGKQMDEAMKALNLTPPGRGVITFYVVQAFLLGILLVWLYAAMRPRFGPGPRTALIAGAFLWITAYLFPTIGLNLMGIFPTGIVVLSLAWTIPEVLIASLAGAWLYKEPTL